MRKFMCAVAWITILPCAGCIGGGRSTPTHYYTLDVRADATDSAPLPLTLQVRRFTAVPSYSTHMARRVSDVQLTFEEFHRWSEAPDELVPNALCRALESARVFRDVVPPDFDASTDLSLTGRVLTFEQCAKGQASVALALALRRHRDNGVLWRKTLSALSPVEGRSPAALARAMSAALGKIVAQCIGEWRKLEGLAGPDKD